MPMSSGLHAFLMVALGGALGSMGRYGVSVLFGSATRFPWATLAVNLLGCFAAGFLTIWLLARGHTLPFDGWKLLVATGVLGGFTTFSAFSLETLRLAEAGNTLLALTNIACNLVGALLAVLLGAWFARQMGL